MRLISGYHSGRIGLLRLKLMMRMMGFVKNCDDETYIGDDFGKKRRMILGNRISNENRSDGIFDEILDDNERRFTENYGEKIPGNGILIDSIHCLYPYNFEMISISIEM
jgi:hypothetical protein